LRLITVLSVTIIITQGNNKSNNKKLKSAFVNDQKNCLEWWDHTTV